MFQILLIKNLYYLVIKMSKITTNKHLGKVLMRDPNSTSPDVCGIASEVFYYDLQVVSKGNDLERSIANYKEFIKEPRCGFINYDVTVVEKSNKGDQSALYAIYKYEGDKIIVSSPHFFFKKSLMFIDYRSMIIKNVELHSGTFYNGRELNHEECTQLFELQVPESLKF